MKGLCVFIVLLSIAFIMSPSLDQAALNEEDIVKDS